MSRVTSRVLLPALVLAMACDDPVSSSPRGSYTAQITGGMSRQLSGTASVVSGTSGYGRPTITLVFGGDGQRDRIALTIARSALPPVGEYRIATFSSEPVESEWIGAYVAQGNPPRGNFLAVSGEVRLTRSGNGRLEGTFALFADGVPEGSQTRLFLEIAGSFAMRAFVQ